MSKQYLRRSASDENHVDEISQGPLSWDEREALDNELVGLFSSSLVKSVETLYRKLRQQTRGMVEGCACYWPGDEGYCLDVSDQWIFEHSGPGEAIKTIHQYVQACMFFIPLSDEEELY